MIKIGVIPLHGWIFSIIENIRWNTILVLSTIQKIIPVWILCFLINFNTIIFFIIVSSFIIIFLPLKVKRAYFFISTSSIINRLWIILSAIARIIATIFYTTIYFLVTTFIIYLIKKNNRKIINHYNINILTLINIFSLIGIPPFLGFISKINSILRISYTKDIINTLRYFSLIVLILSTSLVSFMYLKIFIVPLLNSNNKNLFYFSKNKNNIKIILINFFLPRIVILLEIFS